MTAAAAFFCFSLTASATYILNDLLDLEHGPGTPQQTQATRLPPETSPWSPGLAISISFAGSLGAWLQPLLTCRERFAMYLLLYLA